MDRTDSAITIPHGGKFAPSIPSRRRIYGKLMYPSGRVLRQRPKSRPELASNVKNSAHRVKTPQRFQDIFAWY